MCHPRRLSRRPHIIVSHAHSLGAQSDSSPRAAAHDLAYAWLTSVGGTNEWTFRGWTKVTTESPGFPQTDAELKRVVHNGVGTA